MVVPASIALMRSLGVEQPEREALGQEAAVKLAEVEGRRGVQPLIEGRGVGAGC